MHFICVKKKNIPNKGQILRLPLNLTILFKKTPEKLIGIYLKKKKKSLIKRLMYISRTDDF